MVVKLRDFVVATDPMRRIRRMPGWEQRSLKFIFDMVANQYGNIYFAEADGKTVGYAFCFVTKQSEENRLEVIPTKLGQVEDIYVEDGYRGTGVGKALMAKCEEHLKEKGCDSIWIDVFAPNTDAHEYYKKLGFVDREIGMLKKLVVKPLLYFRFNPDRDKD